MEKSLVLRQKEHATALTAILTNADTAREFERGLTIKKIVASAFPIAEVIREVGYKAVAQTIDVALTKLVASVNVGNNINDAQIKIIVEDLITKYPHESVEDFILVFKKARTGDFGTIYNLHSAVVFGWMDQYLEQKYEEVQRQHDSTKLESKNIAIQNQKDIFQLWQDACDHEAKLAEARGEKVSKPLSNNMQILSNLRGMTDKEIKEEGQEKPKRPVYYSPTVSEANAKLKHIRYLNANYDPMTREKLPGWMEEKEWNENNF